MSIWSSPWGGAGGGMDLSGITNGNIPYVNSGIFLDSPIQTIANAVSIHGTPGGYLAFSAGSSASAAGSRAAAVGYSAQASGEQSLSLMGGQSSGYRSLAAGIAAKAAASEAYCLGRYIQCTGERSILIGSGSTGSGGGLNMTLDDTIGFGANSTIPTMIISDSGGSALTGYLGLMYKTSTNVRVAGKMSASCPDSTDASRTGRMSLFAADYAADREGLRIDADGSAVTSEVFGFQSSDGCYGEIHLHDNSTAQAVATGATYAKFTLWGDNGLSQHCTADVTNDKITFTKPGIYRVSGSFNFSCDTNNIDFLGTVFLNSVEQDHIHFERKISTGGDIGSAGFTGLIDVTTIGWDLDFRVRHSGVGSVDFTLGYGNLNVTYVGKT